MTVAHWLFMSLLCWALLWIGVLWVRVLRDSVRYWRHLDYLDEALTDVREW